MYYRLSLQPPTHVDLQLKDPSCVKSKPMAMTSEDCDQPRPQAQKKRRAYHKKVRTGCTTCKIRRLRCDETKPACTRCTSTGRKCDGYAATPPPSNVKGSPPSSRSSASPPNVQSTQIVPVSLAETQPRADTRLILPRMNAAEVRSYRYFLEVAAPGLSGFFDADFWIKEIPRVAHCHSAIWHAIVCLGAVHESEGGPSASGNRKTAIFGIEQFNLAIQSLRNSPEKNDKGVALTISTIFATMSVLGNKYDHAMMHLGAGIKMLKDIQGDDLKPVTKGASELRKTPTSFESVPISIGPIRNILLRMNMTVKALSHGGLYGSAPPTEILENNIFQMWRTYAAPMPSTSTRSMLTPDIILIANRASESLLNGFVSNLQLLTSDHGPYAEITKQVYSTQEQADAVSRIMEGKVENRAAEVARIATIQRPFVRGYRELSRALSVFESELQKPNLGTSKVARKQLTDAIRPLRLYLATCRILMVLDPDREKPQRSPNHAALCQSIIENAEAILRIGDTWLQLDNGTKVAFTTNSMTMDALFMTAHSSPSLAQRRRAADLMRRPQSEGIWPTLMASKLADAVLKREVEALQEYRYEESWRKQHSIDGVVELARTSTRDQEKDEYPLPDDYDDSPHGLHRVKKLSLKLENGRRARMTLQTWGESAQGLPGRESILEW